MPNCFKNRFLRLRLCMLAGTLFYLSDVYAQSKAYKILDISSSKKSIIVDRGSMEGVQVGDVGKVYHQDNKNPNRPSLTLLADAEAVKVHSNYSYWFLRNIENFGRLRKGQKLIIFRQADDRRRSHRIRSTRAVISKAQSVEEFIDDQKRGVPRDLVFEQEEFRKGKELIETHPTKWQDIETREYDLWVKKKSPVWDDVYLSEVESRHVDESKGHSTDKLRRDQARKVYESSTVGAVAKINQAKYGLKGLHDKALSSEIIGYRDKQTSENSTYDTVKEKEEELNLVSPRALAKIKREGESWSSDMDDEQLRRFFVRSGLAREIRRQKKALGERSGHELNLRYSTALGQHTTSEDPGNQGTDYALSIGYEFHLGKTTATFDNFTAEVELERGISHYDLGGINGRFVEGSLRGYLNWYFWNPPSALDSYMVYLGAGFRRGNATVSSVNLSEEYDYQVISLPSTRFGVKYRFKAGDTRDETVKLGMGLNFLLTYEPVRLNSVSTPQEDISSVLEITQTKFSVGLNFYF